MRICLLILLSLTTVLAALNANAQKVRDFTLPDVVDAFRATPYGVDDMKYIGTRYISQEDSTLMQHITRVVQRDIDFYADFSLIPIDSFYMTTYEIKEMDLLGWQRLGAEFLIKLEAEFPAQNIRGFWRMYHTPSQREVASGQLEYHRTYWRELAHDIANEIVYNSTGERGIFRTKVVYVKKFGQAKELFMADYDGTNEKQLTKTGSINLSPMFSPNQEEVYFTSYMSGEPQMYRLVLKTGEMTQIGDFQGVVAAPSISPDGNKIACVLSKDGNSEIYVLDLKGNIIKRLTKHRSIDSAPSWSPDGQSIVFSSDRTGAPQIYIMDADGLNVRRLTYEGGYNDSPIWADRGERITFVSRTKSRRFDLASINVDGTDYRVLTEVGMNENPHFSPDGKHIIFASSRLSSGDIYTMDLSGQNQRRLTHGGTSSNPAWGPIQ